ncbi:MAG: hypothetical protein Ct9H300mP28_35890 [Pseudomonadota bacterium]|nr:MAG: hypothetical protein Ct9H300mP28_35890 [Pseudomonadota bacterium]
MSLMGIRDLSLGNTPPADRRAVRTRLLLPMIILFRKQSAGKFAEAAQIYIVHNRIDTIYEYGRYLDSILPNVKIVMGMVK